MSGAVVQGGYEGPGGGVERVDLAIAKVSHQQLTAQGPEVTRSERNSPGGVELRAGGNQAFHEGAVGVKDIDQAEARAVVVVVVVWRGLLCIGHVELPGTAGA